MTGVENFPAFIITAFIFEITPGLDTMFVLNKSLQQGKRSGLYATLGVNTGVLIHTLIGAVGITVLLASSPVGFGVVKYVGALYILYMGISGLKSKADIFSLSPHSTAKNKGSKSFWSGFVTNAFNPNVALFFIALFPQFIGADYLNSPIPFVVLGITYAILGIIWLAVLAIFAGALSIRLHNRPKTGYYVQKGSAVAFIVMAVMMVVL